MTKLEKLYEIAREENINIRFFDLSQIGVLGLNVEKEGLPYMIFLDCSVKDNYLLHLETLAHELGHYFTTTGNLINTSNYTEQLQVNKYENKAEKWACEFLITENEIIELINSKTTCVYEMAEKLEVNVDILHKRLEYLSRQKQILDLGNDKYLVLTNLPNFYIFDYSIKFDF